MDVWADPWQQRDAVVTSPVKQSQKEPAVQEQGWEEVKTFGQKDTPVAEWDSPWTNHERENSRDRIDSIINSSDSISAEPSNNSPTEEITLPQEEDTPYLKPSWPEIAATEAPPEVTPTFSDATPEPSDDGGSLSPKSIRVQSQLRNTELGDTDDESEEEEIPRGLGISDEEVEDGAKEFADYQPADDANPKILSSKLIPVDTSLIEELYGNLPAEQTGEEYSDDLLEIPSARQTWDRISRQQTLRGWNPSARDSFVRVTWPGSQVRDQTLKIVSKWGRQGSTSATSNYESGDIFGWNTPSHVGNKSSISTQPILTPKSPSSVGFHSRISSRDVPTPSDKETPMIQFNWSSSSGSLPWSDALSEQPDLPNEASIKPVVEITRDVSQGSPQEDSNEKETLKLDTTIVTEVPVVVQLDEDSGREAIIAPVHVFTAEQTADDDTEWGEWAETATADIDSKLAAKDDTSNTIPTIDGPSQSAVRMHLIAERNLAVPKSRKDIIMPDSFYNELPAKSAIRTYLERKKSTVIQKPRTISQELQDPTQDLSSSGSSPIEALNIESDIQDADVAATTTELHAETSPTDAKVTQDDEKLVYSNSASLFDILDSLDHGLELQTTSSQPVMTTLNADLWDMAAPYIPISHTDIKVLDVPSTNPAVVPLSIPASQASDAMDAMDPSVQSTTPPLLPITQLTPMDSMANPSPSIVIESNTVVHVNDILAGLSSFAYMLH